MFRAKQSPFFRKRFFSSFRSAECPAEIKAHVWCFGFNTPSLETESAWCFEFSRTFAKGASFYLFILLLKEDLLRSERQAPVGFLYIVFLLILCSFLFRTLTGWRLLTYGH